MEGPAFDDLRRRAEDDDARAQMELGVAVLVGLGVEQDLSEARRWFEKAAERGDTVGESWLGEMRWNGSGGEENKTTAEKLWRESFEEVEERALEGDVPAQHRLGRCYFYGRGVAQNHVEAHRWDERAAKSGFAPAQFDLACYYAELVGTRPWNLEKGAQATAEWWYLKAALQGHKGAIERLEKIEELMARGVVAEKKALAEMKSLWEERCTDLEARMQQRFAKLGAALKGVSKVNK
jgi:TPR repeat protein